MLSGGSDCSPFHGGVEKNRDNLIAVRFDPWSTVVATSGSFLPSRARNIARVISSIIASPCLASRDVIQQLTVTEGYIIHWIQTERTPYNCKRKAKSSL